MNNYKKHILPQTEKVRNILKRLDQLASDAIVFIVDHNGKLVGSLTDGDIRRGLIKGLKTEDPINLFLQENPKYIRLTNFDLQQLIQWRDLNYKIIPIVDANLQIIDIINFKQQKSYLPLDAVIMAGGKGTRLRPLTLGTPKPLLKIGDKPIIEYNIDRLKYFGVQNITISINYLGEQIAEYFGDGSNKEISINYVSEDKPLGTLGAVSLIDQFDSDYILVMNSDLLTNIDYENMFLRLLEQKAEMVVATTPYKVEVPYGVIETIDDEIVGLTEKPTYTYYSNAGIYIFNKKHLNLIPKNQFFNAPDLMEKLYTTGNKVIHYPILDYWLDIGKPDDFQKAQEDIKHIHFD